MTKSDIKEKLHEHILLECEVEDICAFLSDMFEMLANEAEAAEPYAINTVRKYRDCAEEITNMGILLIDILEEVPT